MASAKDGAMRAGSPAGGGGIVSKLSRSELFQLHCFFVPYTASYLHTQGTNSENTPRRKISRV